MTLKINNPLNGVPSPFSEESQIILGRLGYLLGLLIESKIDRNDQVLMLLSYIRNKAHSGGDGYTAFTADHLSSGLFEFIRPNIPAMDDAKHSLKLVPVKPKKMRRDK